MTDCICESWDTTYCNGLSDIVTAMSQRNPLSPIVQWTLLRRQRGVYVFNHHRYFPRRVIFFQRQLHECHQGRTRPFGTRTTVRRSTIYHSDYPLGSLSGPKGLGSARLGHPIVWHNPASRPQKDAQKRGMQCWSHLPGSGALRNIQDEASPSQLHFSSLH